MKRNNKAVSFSKRLLHFMKHYSGYILLALFCATVTVFIVGFGG